MTRTDKSFSELLFDEYATGKMTAAEVSEAIDMRIANTPEQHEFQKYPKPSLEVENYIHSRLAGTCGYDRFYSKLVGQWMEWVRKLFSENKRNAELLRDALKTAEKHNSANIAANTLKILKEYEQVDTKLFELANKAQALDAKDRK